MSINKRIFLKEFYSSGPVDKNWAGFNFKTKTYLDEIKIGILNVILESKSISEKSFKQIDEEKQRFDEWCKTNLFKLENEIKKFEGKGYRKEFCIEYCYHKFFNKPSQFITEKRKSEFEVLEKNKVPLTPEERKEVMDADAVWHMGKDGSPSPAVWKGKNSKGEMIYVTNTHRAYNTAKTLKGAISRYHKFIKSTA